MLLAQSSFRRQTGIPTVSTECLKADILKEWLEFVISKCDENLLQLAM